MLRVFFALFLLSYLPFGLYAETARASNIVFSPPVYYVGDLVTLQFTLNGINEKQLHTPIYEKNEKIEVEMLVFTPKEHGTLVTVKFRPYTMGIHNLRFNFGNIIVENIDYTVTSLVDTYSRELRNSYGPRLLVGTRLLITSFLMLLILLPPLSYFALQSLKRLIERISNYIKSPYRKFRVEMSRLYNETTLSDKEFYFRLFHSFRELLSGFSGLKEYRSATEQQLAQLLHHFFSVEETTLIINLYQDADRIKFGGNKASSGQRIKDIDLISRLGRSVYDKGKNK